MYKCTLSPFTTSLKLGKSRLPYALQICGPECTSARSSSRFPSTFIDQSVLAAKAPVVVVLLTGGNKMLGREHESFSLEGGGMEIKCWDENTRFSRLRGMFVMGIKFWDENTRASLWGGWGI